jgi:triacylglycerol lipase
MFFTRWIATALASFDPGPATVDLAKPPVVVIHGIYSSSRDMVRLTRALEADGRQAYAIDLYPRDGTASLEDLSYQLETFITQKVQRRQVDIVAYSMGGIVARHYLQRRSGMQQVRRFISLSAPNHGSLLGWLHPGKGARQMHTRSSFLQQLNEDAHSLKQVNTVCLWTCTDLIILPAKSSVMPQLRNEHLWGVGHFSWITDKRFIRRVVQLLNE